MQRNSADVSGVITPTVGFCFLSVFLFRLCWNNVQDASSSLLKRVEVFGQKWVFNLTPANGFVSKTVFC